MQPNLNFEAVEAYSNLIEKLKKDNTISSIDWEAFLEVKGNKLYLSENNISTDYSDKLKETIVEVYTSADSINSVKSQDLFYKSRDLYRTNDSLYLNHMRWLKNQKRILQS